MGRCVTLVAPTWLTSNYIQADSRKVIDDSITHNITGNTSHPNATLTFANAFTVVPNLGYGISNYQGM